VGSERLERYLKNLRDLLPGRSLFRRRHWIALAIFAVLFGMFLARAALPYRTATDEPDWGSARWIAPRTPAAVGYYRTDFILSGAPKHAFLQVAAPDNFDAYVNGRRVGTSSFSSVMTFDLLDIGGYLEPGRNVIAVRVARQTYPGTAQLLARARWQDAGTVGQIESNAGWRIANHEERQQGGAVAWYDKAFDDIGWERATELDGRPGVRPAHPWATPALLDAFPRGDWIWSAHAFANAVTLRREFELSGGIEHAWLGVAASVPYTLIVNAARAPSAAATQEFMDVYDLGPWLQPGMNTIEIDSGGLGPDARVAVAGLLRTSRGVVDLSSGEQWLARAGGDATHREPVARLGGIDAFPLASSDRNNSPLAFRVPVLRLTELPLPGGLIVKRLVGAVPWIAGVFLVILGATAACLPLVRDDRRATLLEAFTLPLLFASLLIATGFVLSYDVRISEAQVYNWPVAVLLAFLIAAWQASIIRELRFTSSPLPPGEGQGEGIENQ